MFDRSNSTFKSQLPDAEIFNRLEAKTIHPTGVLWGKGEVDVSGDALAIEQRMVDGYDELAQGLVASGVEKARRALRVTVEELGWQFSNKTTLQLSFTLPAGSYATSVLREIIGVQSPSS
jgi:tRNA pseudouridine13 synthase